MDKMIQCPCGLMHNEVCCPDCGTLYYSYNPVSIRVNEDGSASFVGEVIGTGL